MQIVLLGLHTAAVSDSDYTASMASKGLWPNIRYSFRICLDRLRKITHFRIIGDAADIRARHYQI
jgi:hypothetical protein